MNVHIYIHMQDQSQKELVCPCVSQTNKMQNKIQSYEKVILSDLRDVSL